MVVRKYDSATPTQITEENTLHFFYDAQSRPAKVEYDGEMYSYLHNLQGDIVGIVDAGGQTVVQYSYDAWGSPLGTNVFIQTILAVVNPFRYRGYVYDETGLYYLRSRYYSLTNERFINCDGVILSSHSLIDHNIYSYTRNAPVILNDQNGTTPVVYFYHSEIFTKNAEALICDLLSPTDDNDIDYIVNQIEITSIQEMSDAWDCMMDNIDYKQIDVVVILSHGNPHYIENVNVESLRFKKRIKTLILLSCNAGHLGTKQKNVAEMILDASAGMIDRVVAIDGHLDISKDGPRMWATKDKAWINNNATDRQKISGFVEIKKSSVKGFLHRSLGGYFDSIRVLLNALGGG